MFAGGPSNFETDEAREIREKYNMKQSGSLPPPDPQHIFLPCPSGVIWVDISEFGGGEDGGSGSHHHFLSQVASGAIAAPAAAGRGDHAGGPPFGQHQHQQQHQRRGSQQLRSSQANWEKVRFGGTMLTRLAVLRREFISDFGPNQPRSLLGRRRRHPSHDSTSSNDTLDGANGKGGASGGKDGAGGKEAAAKQNEEEIAIELLKFELPPQRGAAEAREAATLSAKQCESYVLQEMQVRQMWRIAMGNAPGLKAEIAKLHATERAKLAMKEYEYETRRLKMAKAGNTPEGGGGGGSAGSAGKGEGGGGEKGSSSSSSSSGGSQQQQQREGEGGASSFEDGARTVEFSRSVSPTSELGAGSAAAGGGGGGEGGGKRTRKSDTAAAGAGAGAGGVFGWLFNRRSFAQSKDAVYDMSVQSRNTRASHARHAV